LRPGAGVLLRNTVLLVATLHVAGTQSVPLDVLQFCGALALLFCWHIWNEAIALFQWPQDD
jgi:hypothetical protein